MNDVALPALAALRLGELGLLPRYRRDLTLRQIWADKQYVDADLRYDRDDRGPIEGIAYQLLNALLMRGQMLNEIRVSLDPVFAPYHGTPEQNVTIAKSLLPLGKPTTDFYGEQAAAQVRLGRAPTIVRGFHQSILKTRIAIIGGGAAGLLIRLALINLGFENVAIFERRSGWTGIWSEGSVYNGSRNNPRDLFFFGHHLSSAPGLGTDVRYTLGATVQHPIIGGLTRHVSRIQPGDLNHQITFTDGKQQHYPIVINCCGFGLPRPFDDPTRMIGPKVRPSAIRFQNPQLKFRDLNHRMLIFVGLGNSTAEMITQLQAHQSIIDIDYRVLTHYPREAIFNPTDTIVHKRQAYRVFRDLSKPNLTSFQGDLDVSHRAYMKALMDGKIIPDVREWDVRTRADRRTLGIRQRGERRVHDFLDFDDLYVLTGYQHTAKSLDAMGMAYGEGLFPHYDFDGELHRPGGSGRDRLSKGYFGFGSVLQAPHNKNAMVIPGMLYQTPHLLFSVIMRVLEHHERVRANARTRRLAIIRERRETA